jgi:hypothetical protein
MKIHDISVLNEYNKILEEEEKKAVMKQRLKDLGWGPVDDVIAVMVKEEWLNDDGYVEFMKKFSNSHDWQDYSYRCNCPDKFNLTVTSIWKLYEQGNSAILQYVLDHNNQQLEHKIIELLKYLIFQHPRTIVVFDSEDFENDEELDRIYKAIMRADRL